jgi:TolB-like protein
MMTRITAQLIQVEDGFHLWSESYDREFKDIFAIQDELPTPLKPARCRKTQRIKNRPDANQ